MVIPTITFHSEPLELLLRTDEKKLKKKDKKNRNEK